MPREHVVDVDFSGPDLHELLQRVTRDELLARVPSLRLVAQRVGFVGGFAYLDGWPQEWAMPRRVTSRDHVPAGSFGVAGTMAGFYAIDSPGGWNLVGWTNDVPSIDVGDVVTIRPATLSRGARAAERDGDGGEVVAEIVAPGQLTIATDRPFDVAAAAIANRAVGNPDGTPLLECVMVAPSLRTSRRIAFCDGALRVSDAAGGRFGDGLRGYVAIEGGIAPRRRTLRAGDALHPFTGEPRAVRIPHRHGDRHTIRARRGPHDAPELPREWIVTPQLNRIGIRLRPLVASPFVPPADLPSVEMQTGSIQWHPDGSIVAMGPDSPITGGYLQPAIVLDDDIWKLAQLSPGERVTLIIQ